LVFQEPELDMYKWANQPDRTKSVHFKWVEKGTNTISIKLQKWKV
jgi:hypothetical protein